MNTAMKVLSATTPTKKAATHSIESMKRSMKFLPAGAGGPVTTPSGETSESAVMTFPWRSRMEARHSGALARASEPGIQKSRHEIAGSRFRAPRNDVVRLSNPGAVLHQHRLQFGVDRSRVAAGLLDSFRPAVAQRPHCLLPFGELVRRQRIDLVALQRLHLGAAVGLELGPGVGDLGGPFRRAVIIDDLLLRICHRVVLGEVHV